MGAPPSVDGFVSTRYWERRYGRGGNSGAGSYGALADYKTSVVNGLIAEHELASITDLGCGDGNQIDGLAIGRYAGFDVSPTAVDRCRRRYADRTGWTFDVVPAGEVPPADAAISLDVIFHLVEDDVFHAYMSRLFGAARRLVVIYSTDHDETVEVPHVRHRDFGAWIRVNAPGWRRLARLDNPYGARGSDPDAPYSPAYFQIFTRDAVEE